MHKRKYEATDAGGSLKVSGRYNRGRDLFSEHETWPALYLALSAEICLGEIMRHITPALLPQLNGYRLSEIAVYCAAIVDCTDVPAIGVRPDDLLHDTNFPASALLAEAVIAKGAEGMIVPSATRLGNNLIIFPNQMRAGSTLTVVGERDPCSMSPAHEWTDYSASSVLLLPPKRPERSERPPSTQKTCPVTYAAASEQK